MLHRPHVTYAELTRPLKWSRFKKTAILLQISLVTVSMYMGSSIYGPGITDLSVKFGISQVAASLGITMFVLGYAVGPVSPCRDASVARVLIALSVRR